MNAADRDQYRSFWGWGRTDADLPADFVERFKSMLLSLFEMTDAKPLPEPRIEEIALRPPRFALPGSLSEFSTDAAYDRAGHTYGKALRDVFRALYRNFDNPPDYVAYPGSEQDLQSLMAFCSENNIALVPYGGGSSVVGGVEMPLTGRYRGSISCDMRHFNQIVAVHPASRTARIQAGIYGPALESELKKHGFTLRHYPQSFEFSTLGGWIATRAGGHFASLYTHIDEFVEALRVMTPGGVFETRELPGTGDGPDANRMMIGSEGIFGIITEAVMRLQTIPTMRYSAPVRFTDEKDGMEALRRISQAGLYPANCRLVSALESFAMGIGSGEETILLLGFESHDHPQEARLRRALEICRKSGGKWEEAHVRSPHAGQHDRNDPGRTWKDNFLRAPYLRDALARTGIISETFETAITWERLESLHERVQSETRAAMKNICGNGLLMWRFTHVYPDGPAIYYTVAAPARPGHEIDQWDRIKKAASDAIISAGGTITHHHAVGRVHRPWYEASRPARMGEILGQVKKVLDPRWILNPEVLIAPENDADAQSGKP